MVLCSGVLCSGVRCCVLMYSVVFWCIVLCSGVCVLCSDVMLCFDVWCRLVL